jgi:hypothetical protein
VRGKPTAETALEGGCIRGIGEAQSNAKLPVVAQAASIAKQAAKTSGGG